MISLADVCSCVKRLHPDLRRRVNAETLIKYQKAVECFTTYLHRQPDLTVHSAEDLDFLIMEYRTEMDLTRSQHVLIVAAIEFFLPYAKGKLVICREALKGRTTAEPTKHTTPLTTELAVLFGAYMASTGKPQVGAAMIIQQATGLRPSELLSLQKDHAYMPPDCTQAITLRLGAVVSTKVKREQFVLVRRGSQSLAYALLSKLHAGAADGARLFPFGYSFYNNSFKQCEQHYQLQLGLTAHSPRAGFATSQVIAGVPVKDIQAAGRWLCESSFQTYVDVVAAAHIRAQVNAKQLEATFQWVSSRVGDYFDLPRDVAVQSGITSRAAGLQIKNSPGPDSRSSRLPQYSSEEAVANGPVGKAVGQQGVHRHRHFGLFAATTKGKGKGRGVLRRRQPTSTPMD